MLVALSSFHRGADGHVSLPWELSPIGIITQVARPLCGHGQGVLFSRRAFPHFFLRDLVILIGHAVVFCLSKALR